MTAPIVSVSIGLPAVFLWGGLKRKDPTRHIPLVHGDGLVWGGPDWLRYHGVRPLKVGHHALLGEQRINLTFRQAGQGTVANGTGPLWLQNLSRSAY